MTPGAEGGSRQAVRQLCGEFAVSVAARQVEVTVQLQMDMASGDEVRQGWGLLGSQEIPVRISPQSMRSDIRS